MDVLVEASDFYRGAPLADPSTQIRLLHSIARIGDPDLTYEFIVCSLSDAPTYDAISYTWGENINSRFVRVNGVPVTITANCHEALRQARLFGSHFTWIDSVCINQQHPQEKSAQVAIMWDIYHSASRVLVCIGVPDEASEGVCAALFDIKYSMGLAHHNPYNLSSPVEKENESALILGPADDPEDEIESISTDQNVQHQERSWALSKGAKYCKTLCEHFNQLVKRPYFSRLWIAQELHAGDSRVSIMFRTILAEWSLLNDLDSALYWASEETAWLDEAIMPSGEVGALNQLMMIGRKRNQQSQVFGHLELSSRLHCQDARDQIFGTLHFIDWAQLGVPPLSPDYTKSACEVAVSLGLMKEVLHISFGRFVQILEALRISIYDPLLEPLLLDNTIPIQRKQSDVLTWELQMNYKCRLNKLTRFWGRALIQNKIADTEDAHDRKALLEAAFGETSAKKLHVVSEEPYSGARDECEEPDLPPLSHRCIRMLMDDAVAQGYGWDDTGLTQDYLSYTAPHSASVGDIVLTSLHRSESAIVMRIDTDLKMASSVGRAARFSASPGQNRQKAHFGHPWGVAKVTMEATVEEMIALCAEYHNVPEIHFGMPSLEPLAFGVPKIVSFATASSWADYHSGKVIDYAVVPLEQMPSPDESTDEDIPHIEFDVAA